MKNNRLVESAALLLVNQEGKLYCVEELKPKPEFGKRAGDRSFPWETQEGDEPILHTLARGAYEEVDDSYMLHMTPPNHIGTVFVCEGRVLAHVYLATFISGPESMRGAYAGVEIEPLGWQTREFLLARCRTGVQEVLQVWDRFVEELTACN